MLVLKYDSTKIRQYLHTIELKYVSTDLHKEVVLKQDSTTIR